MSLGRIGVNIMVPVLASRQEEAGLFLPQSFVFQGKNYKVAPKDPRDSDTSIHNMVSWQGGLRVRMPSRTGNGVR